MWLIGGYSPQDIAIFMLTCVKNAGTFLMEVTNESLVEAQKILSWVT